MANTTIRNIVKTATNQPIQGVNVVIDLAVINSDGSLSFPQGFIDLGNATTDYSVNYLTTATTDVNGTWTAQVPGNAAYTNIVNSVYRVIETYGGISRTYYLSVPNDGQTYWVGSILTSTPGVVGTNFNMNDLGDVNTSGISANDYLIWNGTNFVPFSPYVTRNVITQLGGANSGSSYAPPQDFNCRYLMSFPVKPKRFRLRIKNYKTLDGSSGSGTASVTAWYGTPAVNTSSPYRWTGAFTTTPTQIPIAGSTNAATLSGATELVTDWITDSSIKTGVDTVFSIGYTNLSSFNTAGQDSVGGLTRVNSGAGGAANSSSFTATTSATYCDVRIEYEYQTQVDYNGQYRNKKVLFIGDSITAGHLQSDFAPSGPYNFRTNTFPELVGLKNNIAIINAGVGQARWLDSYPTGYGWSSVTSTSHPFLSRVNWGSDTPDACIIALGTNDCGGNSSLATIQDAMKSVIDNVRSMGINNIYLCTILPGGYGLPISVTATASSGATALTSVSSVQYITPGMPVSGTSIPSGTVVTAITGINKIEISNATTGAINNASLNFGSSTPHWTTDAREIIRQQLNEFIRTMPFNVQGVFDITRTVELNGMVNVADARYLPYYPHPHVRGFQKIAEIINLR